MPMTVRCLYGHLLVDIIRSGFWASGCLVDVGPMLRIDTVSSNDEVQQTNGMHNIDSLAMTLSYNT